MTTEALVFLGELDPERIGPALEWATHYEPTPLAEADALLDAAPLAPSTATFVDLGAGMGRVVLLAARRPFRAVIGVEISPALVEIARENLRDAHDPARVVRDVRIVQSDAAGWAPPHGPLVAFLYNPFGGPVLDGVLDRLAAHPAPVALLYHTPVERESIAAHPVFAPVADLGFGAIWVKNGA